MTEDNMHSARSCLFPVLHGQTAESFQAVPVMRPLGVADVGPRLITCFFVTRHVSCHL